MFLDKILHINQQSIAESSIIKNAKIIGKLPRANKNQFKVIIWAVLNGKSPIRKPITEARKEKINVFAIIVSEKAGKPGVSQMVRTYAPQAAGDLP